MTLSPDDLAAMGERHRPNMTARYRTTTRPDALKVPLPGPCFECGQDWPCDSRRLLDEVEARTTALTDLATKLRDLTPSIQAQYTFAFVHGQLYDGPTYADELGRALELLGLSEIPEKVRD